MMKMSPAQAMCGAHDENQPSMMEIIKRVFNEGYINDHDKGGGLVVPVAIIIRTSLDNGLSEVCPAITGTRGFCLNPFYYNEADGHVHMSTCSVGGDVILYSSSGLDEAISVKNMQELTSPYATLHEHCSVIYRKDFKNAFKA